MFPTFTAWARALIAKTWAAVPFLTTAAVLVVVVALGNGLYAWVVGDAGGEVADASVADDCNVLGVELHGVMMTYLPEDFSDMPEDPLGLVSVDSVIQALELAEGDDSIRAVLVEIDSPGGDAIAGEEIANTLKRMTKPTAVYIRAQGASAAYWAATGADKIFASKNSDVGSIGVTQSFTEPVDPDYRFVSLSVGKYKDAGNPDKPLTSEERELFMRNLKIVYENFISDVSANRGLSPEAVRALADGSTVLGEEAQRVGLIDDIGSYVEARRYLGEEIGEPAVVCWY